LPEAKKLHYYLANKKRQAHNPQGLTLCFWAFRAISNKATPAHVLIWGELRGSAASFADFEIILAVFLFPQHFYACAVTCWACAAPTGGKTS